MLTGILILEPVKYFLATVGFKGQYDLSVHKTDILSAVELQGISMDKSF